jgi:hypothetical protein
MESSDEQIKILHLLQENNRILKSQERRAKLHLLLKIIWVFIFVGIPLLTYLYFKDTIQENLSFISNLQDIKEGNVDIPALLELYGIQPTSN